MEIKGLINQALPMPLSARSRAVLLRAIWLAVTSAVIILLVMATPWRFRMLRADVYGFGQGLQAMGLSLNFFATYFVVMELLVIVGSLLVAALIAWKRSDDWFAILVAISLSLFGLLPPLIDGLIYLSPQWTLPIVTLRFIEFGCMMAVFCLFPNGRFAPPWTRWLLLLYMIIWSVLLLINPRILADTAVLPNTRTLDDASWVLFGTGWFLLAIIGQIVRYRGYASPTEKQQMKWVLFGFSLSIIFSLASSLLLISVPGLTNSPDNEAGMIVIMGGIYLLTALVLPVSIALSMLRYRLWDVDFLINRTLVYGGLSLAIVAIYVLVVGSLGTLFQSQGSFFVALLATGLAAVLFQPLRSRLQKSVNRLMFGERDDPYKVLSQLGWQLQTTSTPQATLHSMVETIAGTLKLPYVAIELAGEEGRMNGAAVGTAVAQTADLPLHYQNETVGYLVASPRSPGESFTEREQQLLADIARQAGAVAYSVRLTAALQQSREKMVLAREEERRRIRRDLHDELGPTLASQTFALDTALELLETDPNAAARLLQTLKSQNQETVADIRRLVHELRPPALDELGLAGALRAQVGRLSSHNALQINIISEPDPLPPLPAAVEAAAYRIALEAVNNVVKHARAENCTVSLRIEEQVPNQLIIEILDDGDGLPSDYYPGVGLHSMRERAEELGGTFETGSGETGGTRVTAVLPL
ncbi:MAG: GAF domain-containing sensor histidine kinase [Candidatus Promineifilaceae bacterium]